MFPGVFIVEAVDVGEDNQQVGAHQVADEGGQVVVVAEFELEFIGGHGVVFVDDGHHPPLEQGEQGIAGVEEALAGLQVVVGQEDLGHLEAEAGEGLFVGQHQGALAGGGHRLLLRDAGGTAAQAQFAAARGDGPGGDDDELPLAALEGAALGHQPFDQGQVEAVGRGQDRARPP